MRESRLSSALRAYNASVWGVIMAVDDTKAMQTVTARGVNGELFTGIQRPQVYGVNSVPVNPDDNGGEAAEVAIGFRDGNRAFPFIMAEGDRRTRPKNWQQGDIGIWHYKGATAKFTAAGWLHDAGADKQPAQWTVGNDVVTIADMKFTAQVGGSQGPAVVVKPSGVYLGGDPDVLGAGSFFLVQTLGGPAKNVYALVG